MPRWRGGDLDRLADEDHARLVRLIAARLEALGWEIRVEVSFSVYGERGSMDLLAWHPATRTLLVVEVKTTLTSVEETLRRHDMKVRLAPTVASERFGWRTRAAARLLVLPEGMTERRRVERHDGVIARVYPLRGRDARAWLGSPAGAAGLLVFLSDSRDRTGRGRVGPRRRVRRRRSQPSAIADAPQA